MVAADYFKVERNTINNTAFMSRLVAEHAGIDLDEVVVNTDLPGVVTYVVKRGDTIGTIASKFGTTIDNIQSVNNLSNGSFLRVGQKLIVSEVPGILYTVQDKTNVIVFANQYSLDLEELKNLNSFQDSNQLLFEWDEIFLPVTNSEAMKKGLIAKPIYRPAPPVVQVVQQAPRATPTISNPSAGALDTTLTPLWDRPSPTNGTVVASWSYNADINNGFARGHCTWYAAIKRQDIFPFIEDGRQDRPFRGDARAWFSNAQAAGLATGPTPRPGSVVVYSRGSGVYAGYGHVGIVVSVDRNERTMLIEEMNFLKRYVVTQRSVPIDDSRIAGYIY